MKFLSSLAISAIQFLLFVLLWDAAVNHAASIGHGQRGGVAFGITVLLGAWSAGGMFLIGSIVGGLVQSFRIRWSVFGALLAGWTSLLWSSLDSYPVRAGVFFALGASILVVGSGVIAPFIANRRKRDP